MTLLDDNTTPNQDSATSTLTENLESHPESSRRKRPLLPSNPSAHQDEKPSSAGSEDFASALESFTTESEEAAGDDKVLKGTVLKLTRHSRGGGHRRQVGGHAAPGRSAGSSRASPASSPATKSTSCATRAKPRKATSISRTRKRRSCAPGTRLRKPTTRRSPFRPRWSSASRAA